MMVNLIDKLSDSNPQLLRELKGRLKALPVGIAVIISMLVQLLLFFTQFSGIPNEKYPFYGEYCGLRTSYEQQRIQLQEQYYQLQHKFLIYSDSSQFDAEKIQNLRQRIAQIQEKIDEVNGKFNLEFCPVNSINMQKWWQHHYANLFLTLSIVFVFTLIVAGTYLLINDLSKEERRGTLNFIRLSPQTAISIFTGKLLGVPSLIYLLTLVAVPLHFWSGLAAGVPLINILSFWAVLIASSIFFYSASMLFGLCGSWLGSFQPWLGSGLISLFLVVTMQVSYISNHNSSYVTSWLMLLSPFSAVVHLFPALGHTYGNLDLENLQWFYLPIGANQLGFVAFNIVNYTLCSFWLWQAIKRCFHHPNATILSKVQSYQLVLCFQVMISGFAVQQFTNNENWQNVVSANFILLSLHNLVLFIALMAILLPHRQALQDWARYRYQDVTNNYGFWYKSLTQDLLKGEKSPALLAIAINLVIATIPLLIGIVLLPVDSLNSDVFHTLSKIKLILGVALFFSLMMIYATLAQIMLMMRTSMQANWAISTVSVAIFLTPIVFLSLGVQPDKNPLLWLFSTFPWASLEYTATTTIFLAFLGELSVLTLLVLRLTSQLKLAGVNS